MIVLCEALRAFPYSLDGFTTLHAERGELVDIPEDLVEGLADAGYLRVATKVENKAIAAAPDVKVAPAAAMPVKRPEPPTKA